MNRNAGKTTSASVMPSAFEGWMWCIQEGAPVAEVVDENHEQDRQPAQGVDRGHAAGHTGIGLFSGRMAFLVERSMGHRHCLAHSSQKVGERARTAPRASGTEGIKSQAISSFCRVDHAR